jgi:hypothetical protein
MKGNKKLLINKQTIVNLDSSAMGHVNGGGLLMNFTQDEACVPTYSCAPDICGPVIITVTRNCETTG